MLKPIIEISELRKDYETSDVITHALRGIELTINSGDYVAISGPSGCGKSTLLSILGLLEQPSDGKYLIGGIDVTELEFDQAAELRNRKIGFIFQSFNLIDDLSVLENVALPLRYHPNFKDKDKIISRAEECLSMVDMSHRLGHKPNQLSGGQQQRVAIARALVANPSLLLVDEPTGNLDSKSGDEIMAILRKLSEEGTTICMVTHDYRYANMAKTQLTLSDGKIVSKQDMRKAI